MPVNQNGFVNSLDSLISVLIAAMLIIALFTYLANFSLSAANEQRQLSLHFKGLALADSIVKIPFNDCCSTGFADVDNSLNRTIQNKISISQIKSNKSKLQELEQYSLIRKLSIIFKSGQQLNFIDRQLSNDCISFERFVLADSQKAKLVVVVCDE